MSITLVGEVVNSADATTGYSTGNISGDDDHVEGSGAIGVKASATTVEMYTTSLGAGAPYNFSSGGDEEGYHIIMWFNTKTPVQGATSYGGLRIVVGNGTSRGHWNVDPLGFYKGGFITNVVNPERPFESIAAGSWTLGSNPSQLTSISQMGGVFDTITSIMGSFNNVQLDQFTIGLGLRADGAGNDFEVVRIDDEENNFYGWWSSKNGAYVGKGKLYIGPASGSAACDFSDNSISVVFAAERVAEGFYEINVRGAGTDVDWNLLNISSAVSPRPYSISDVGFRERALDVSGDDSDTRQIFFKPDGTELYFIGNTNNRIYQRTLSTAWDLNSAGSASSFLISGDTTNPGGLWFSDDGSVVYYTDFSADIIYQRTLSTPWDITTAGSASSLNVSADTSVLAHVSLSPDGYRLYYGGSDISERLLGTAWDITSAGSENAFYDVSAFGVENQGSQLIWNPTGTAMFLIGQQQNRIYEIPLTTGWDMSTADAPTTSFDIVNIDTSPEGVFFGENGQSLYVSGGANSIIRELSIGNETRWNLTIQSDTNSFTDTDGVWSGADVIDLDDSATLLRTTLIDCNNIILNSAVLDNITVLNSYLDIGEAFIEANTLATISDSGFTASAEGHAIEITTAGTYSFVGNQFTGYGPGTCDSSGIHSHTFDTITDVDASTEEITISGDPFITGDPVYYSDEGGSDTIGLTDGNLYYVRRQSASTYTIHLDSSAALDDVDAINLNDGSTGEDHVLYSARAAIYNSSGGTVTINVSGGGDTPTIRNDSDSTTVINNNVAVTFTGLKDNTEVRVYADGTLTELDGVEAATDGSSDNRSVTFSLAASVVVDIRFAHGTAADGFTYLVPPNNAIEDFIWPSTTTSLPITQIIDRNFNNP